MHARSGNTTTSRCTALAARLLGLVVVLAAVITMPICHFNNVPSVVGADARTITESRSEEEHFRTPGMYRLHDMAATDACDICQDQQVEAGHSANRIEDLSERVALLPDLPAAAGDPEPREGVEHLLLPALRTPAPDSPPPNAVAA